MILPTKHISVAQSYLGMGAQVLAKIDRPITLTRLWERVREAGAITSYENFVLTLDLLYCLDAVEFNDGLLRRRP